MNGPAAPAGAFPGRAGGRRPSLFTLVLCASISPLAVNVFAPSMPGMALEFQVPYTTIQYGLTLYLLMTAVLQTTGGPLSDYVGRKPVLLGGMALFLVGTAICLWSDNIGAFLFGRILQGASAVGILLSRAVIRDIFDDDSAIRMISYVAMGMTLTPMIGPAIGGVLDDLFGWRACFVMLGISGIFAVAIIAIDLPETNPRSGRTRRQLEAYSRLMREPRFWAFVATTCCGSGVFFVYMGAAPIIAERMYDVTTSEYGFWFALCAAGYMGGSFLTSRTTRRFGVERLLVFGALSTLAAACFAMAALNLFDGLSRAWLFMPLLLIGFGSGMTTPNAAYGAVSVVPSTAGAAAGVVGASQMAFGAIAVQLGGVAVRDGTGTLPFGALLLALALAGVAVSLALLRRPAPAN